MRHVYPFIDRARVLLQPFSKRVNLDILLASADPAMPLGSRIDWLQDLMQWLRSPFLTNEERSSLTDKTRHAQRRQRKLQMVRLRYFFHLLERNQVWKAQVAAVLRSIFLEASAADLFSSTGLNKEGGFFSEASTRLQRKLLPAPADEQDFGALFVKIFKDESDPLWIKGLPIPVIEQFLALVRFGASHPDQIFTGLRSAMIDSLLILAPDIAAKGLLPELRLRMDNRDISTSPFYALNETLLAFVLVVRGRDQDLMSTLISKIKVDIKACRGRISEVYRHLEEKGVSVALVYRLESLTSSLTRVETLINILVPDQVEGAKAEVNEVERARDFVSDLVAKSLRATGFKELLADNFDLLSRKIVERVGYAGDHYIAATAKQYWQMLMSGGGGGLVTVFTTVFKTVILHGGFPLFFEGFFVALNYSGSFLIMQAAHFSLATKQPSMTATALANKLATLSQRHQLEEFVDEVARITRTQFAAAAGNVLIVIPGAFFFHFLYSRAVGHALMDPVYAHHTIESFNPFTSITVPAAALTGVILWASAVMGGALENWAVFRRMPETISSNRTLVALFSESGSLRLSKTFSREIAGIGSNISIGLLLAFTPIVGKFFGLPLDIRHVTLSSGSMSFAIAALGLSHVTTLDFWMGCLGIFLMLILNFGVAYSFALFVALRARRIKRVWVYHLINAVGRRLVNHGGEFIFPIAPKKR